MNSSIERAGRGLRAEWRLHVVSVVSLAVAFLCLGAALLVVFNVKVLEERWGRLGRASVYLRDGAPSTDVDAIVSALRSTPGVRGARYLSPADAKATVMASDRGLTSLPLEAFPASIEVDIGDDVADGDVASMVGKLKALSAVEAVETYGAWTARISSVLKTGTLAATGLAAAVFSAVLAVVGSTMRLALARRKSEVEVLKLVGASDAFVRAPYVLEGTFQGTVGSLLALVILAVLFTVVRGRVDESFMGMLGLAPTFLPWSVVASMILTGAALGALGGALGLRRLTTV